MNKYAAILLLFFAMSITAFAQFSIYAATESEVKYSYELTEYCFSKNFRVEWKVKCNPIIDTTYFGEYFIRITEECK